MNGARDTSKRLLLRRLAVAVAVLIATGLAAFWLLTEPATVPASALPAYAPNLANGKTMFNAGGCASCHAVPNKDPDKVDPTRLGGGLALPCPFGTFYVPNISPDPKDGIGDWSEADFVSAMWDGTAPGGYHLFPAFPYGSFRHMQLNDVRDLFAYLKTLPPVTGKVRGPDLAFPFSVRRLVGVWKLLFLRGGPFVPDAAQSAQWNRGAYLVNGPAHCAECHSPRDFLGGIIESERFAGGPTPDGKDWVPNITPVGLRQGDNAKDPWSQADIASFLSDGMTPDGDFAGGAMSEVIRNTSQLGKDDRAAIAAYIASLPPRQGPAPPPKNKN
jgi:mono/diheme cytochrome c family protein